MSLLVTGSVAIDTIQTPLERREGQLGGAASPAVISASFFTQPHLLGVIGTDFPQEYLNFFRERNIDLSGLVIEDGKSFHWEAEYLADMNHRKTLTTDLNVFEHFYPTLPLAYRKLPFGLLSTIMPRIQHHVLDQMEAPACVIADTMNLWIETTCTELLELLKRIDIFSLNDEEARLLTGKINLIEAGEAIRELGPEYVIIKKGEHGSLLFGPEKEFLSCPAFPVSRLNDPTGAGDAFVGGLMGYLVQQYQDDEAFLKREKKLSSSVIRRAVAYGSVMASFAVEDFNLAGFEHLDPAAIEERLVTLSKINQF